MHSALSAILCFTLAVLWKLEGARGTGFWYSVVPEVRHFAICDLPFAYVSESLFGLSTPPREIIFDWSFPSANLIPYISHFGILQGRIKACTEAPPGPVQLPRGTEVW